MREEYGMKLCPTKLSERCCAPVCRQNRGNVPPIRRGTAQKMGGHPKKFFPALRAGFVPPTFKTVPAPLNKSMSVFW